MRIEHYLVQDRTIKGEYTDILHRKSFNVNMRIYQGNTEYRDLIISIINYMVGITSTKFGNYTEIKGLSGANVGIPFNIIVVCNSTKDPIVMINPEITRRSKETRVVNSNCGSICLEEPIKIVRNVWVDVSWYDAYGEAHSERFKGAIGSTIQHEVNHNLGILITDRG